MIFKDRMYFSAPCRDSKFSHILAFHHVYEQHFIEAHQIIMPQEGTGQPPTGGVEKLHLDEVSGKMVSKSELKRLQKQREAEEKKQKRAAAAPPKPEKKKT